MIYRQIKESLEVLIGQYKLLSLENELALKEIALAEIPEMVYNSNAIENSTLSLDDTEKILSGKDLQRKVSIRELYEAKNLGKITTNLLEKNNQNLSEQLILDLHKTLLSDIDDSIAGRFRSGKEWVRVGTHLGANPQFVPRLMQELVANYNSNNQLYFLDKIAYFHAELETVHPFLDGNGRIGRVLINWQLANIGLPPIIVPNKTKNSDYYPLFTKYQANMNYDGFSRLFALLLQESLHKRIALLTAGKIIPLALWSKNNSLKLNVTANKAKRQTIPAFRLRGKWMIDKDFKQ